PWIACARRPARQASCSRLASARAGTSPATSRRRRARCRSNGPRIFPERKESRSVDASTSSQGRREDLRLISGKGRYTADWDLDGQAHACFLRSDRAHAEIVSIDTDAARAVPGVLAVLTGADMVAGGFKTPPAILFM